MSAKSLLAALTACATLAACAPPEPVQVASPAKFEPIDQACAGRDGWSDPAPPAHVFANVYMVGTCGIVSLLVTTPQGHILIDGATAEAAPSIAENIRKLGFDPKDVRYLLASHEHLDHVGGLAELKRITGAKFVSREAASAAMASGKPGPTDPQLGAIPEFDGVRADLLLKDGDQLRLGKQALTMLATPGHTPGGTSWTWISCEGSTCHWFVYADSLSAVSSASYRFTDHPAYVAVLRGTIKRIETMKDCDILITPHPAQSDFFERVMGEVPLVDTERCAKYAAAARDRLDTRLAKEATN